MPKAVLLHSSVLGLLLAGNGILWQGQVGQGVMTRPENQEGSGVEAVLARTLIPQSVGPWIGSGLAVDDKTVQILETDDIAVMEYRREGDEPVWFAQVAGFGKRAAFHPPELCLIGSHFEVLQRAPQHIEVAGRSYDVMRLVIGQEGRIFEAWYWFTAGGRTTANYYQQQGWLIWDTLVGHNTAGTLVRVSTPIIAGDEQASSARLRSFMEHFQAVQG
jgi:EpsI family protein